METNGIVKKVVSISLLLLALFGATSWATVNRGEDVRLGPKSAYADIGPGPDITRPHGEVPSPTPTPTPIAQP